MAYPKIPNNDLIYPAVFYNRSETFQHIFRLNEDNLYTYLETGNWNIPNQNILVKFLNGLLVDISDNDEYIYNNISAKANNVASALKMTSIYNKGEAFTQVVFPEKDHLTLIHVPFGKPRYSCKHYFNVDIKLLNPITTLYTTDTMLRYETTKMSETVSSGSLNNDYSVILIDPHALGIGFVRYCRKRIAEGHDVGINTNSYIAGFVLANFYLQHNQYVLTNLFEHDVIKTDTPKFNVINSKGVIKDYIDFQVTVLRTMKLKSIHQFIGQLTHMPVTKPLLNSIYPYTGTSRLFNRMEWIYGYGTMDLVYKYLVALRAQGGLDRQTINQFRRYGRGNHVIMTMQISDVMFKGHFINLHKEIKSIVF